MITHKNSLSGLVVGMMLTLFVFTVISGCAAIYFPVF